jgi:transposase
MIVLDDSRKGTSMNVIHRVELTVEEREQLLSITSGGKHGGRTVKRAQILLAADKGVSDEDIAVACSSSTSTVFRTKRRLVEQGLAAALSERPRTGGERMLTKTDEAKLIALACADPPPGRSRWTLQLLANELIRLVDVETISRETVRRRLEESDLKPWREKMWCIPKVDAEFVARMEDVLDLYAEAPDATKPVICFDEKPVQLLDEVRAPMPTQPGQLRLYDYEYRRAGTANLFMFLDAKRPWRHVKVTPQRTKHDFAECMKNLVDDHYPDATMIRVVMDNLSTHKPAALYEAFDAVEARRILRKLEFHYTPKHGSWLNMVEVENGVIQSQCLDRRIADVPTLARETSAWAAARNAEGATVHWRFNVDDARQKMAKAYPPPAPRASPFARAVRLAA